MDLTRIQEILGNAYQSGTLVVYALLVFGVIVLIGALIVYLVRCARYKGTEMNGLLRMSVTLNEWPENPPVNAPPRLDYGEIVIHMHDSAVVQEDRLDPALTWLEKASCREYEVVRLIERYCKALENSGLYEDAGVVLLRRMLAGNHCVGMGKICRVSAKKGLEIRETMEKKRDKENANRLMVYKMIPESLANEFGNRTACEALNLCVTLEYLSRS